MSEFTIRVMDRLPFSVIKEAYEDRTPQATQLIDGNKLALTKGPLQELRWYVAYFGSDIVAVAGLGNAVDEWHNRGKWTVPEFRRMHLQNALRNESVKFQKDNIDKIQRSYGKTIITGVLDEYEKQGSIVIPGHEHPAGFREGTMNWGYSHIYSEVKKLGFWDIGDLKYSFNPELLKD